MDRLNVFHFYFKHSINSCNYTIGVLLNMFEVIRKSLHKNFKFKVIHCLNDEAAIMRKEEKWTTFALTLSSFESHVSVSFGWQRILDLIFCNVIHFSYIVKNLGSILKDSYLFINCQHGLFFLDQILDSWMNLIKIFFCFCWALFENFDSSFKIIKHCCWFFS